MKTTSLPSVEEKTQDFLSDVTTDIDLLGGDAKNIHYHYLQSISQDRNQAYTSLVEGIEGMTYAMNVDEYLELVEKWEGKNYDQPFDDGYAQALKDIRENVVNPLYGKK